MSTPHPLTPLSLVVAPMLAIATMAWMPGCMPLGEGLGGAGRPSGPATTTNKVAPAGDGVAMLDLFGNWFYILRTPDGDPVFTQRGDFALRADGKIVYDGGWYVQGFKADDEGQLRTDKLRDLKIVIGEASPVRATTRVQLKGNVNPEDAEVGDTITTSFKVYDANGSPSTIHVAATLTIKDSTGTELQFDIRLGSANGTLLARATFRFDEDGDIMGQSALQISSSAAALSFNLEVDAVQASSRRDAYLKLAYQNGLGTGTLKSYTIGNDGGITGQYTNGLKLLLGQFVIAWFNNPGGLSAVPGRSDLFTATGASGQPRPAISVAE